MNNNFTIYSLIVFFCLNLSSCKLGKESSDVNIQLDGTSLKLLDIDFTGIPEISDSLNFSMVKEGKSSSLSLGEKNDKFATWMINDKEVGYGYTVNHIWEGNGIQKVSAIFLDNSIITSYVYVQPIAIEKQTEIKSEKDLDEDGIPDNVDMCPETKGSKSNKGCPQTSVLDTDNDGISDKEDKCPTQKGNKNNKGCPEIIDSDKDGVSDDQDACPNEAGSKKYKGCPLPASSESADADSDGVPDGRDKCPNQKGVAEYDGCPPPAVAAKEFRPNTSSTTYRLNSAAALEDENESAQTSVLRLRPSVDMILFEAKLKASTDGKIEVTLEGEDIRREITIIKSVNPGSNTIRFNDFKNSVLRAGKSYTLTIRGMDDVKLTIIKNAFSKESVKPELSISGKYALYDIMFKY